MQIPLFYDSLLAKLICWGQNRTEAIRRLQRALNEYTIAGVRTTIPFHQWLLQHPAFLAGEFSTDFIAEKWQPDEVDLPSAITSPTGELTAPEVAVLVATLAAEAADQAEVQRRQTDTSAEAG